MKKEKLSYQENSSKPTNERRSILKILLWFGILVVSSLIGFFLQEIELLEETNITSLSVWLQE